VQSSIVQSSFTHNSMSQNVSVRQVNKAHVDETAVLQLIQLVEDEEDRGPVPWGQRLSFTEGSSHKYIELWRWTLDLEKVEPTIETIVGSMIVFNAIFIGISMDHSGNRPPFDDGRLNPWLAVDMVFSTIFLGELALKIWLHGVCGHFRGSAGISNFLDAFVILIDVVQLSFLMFSPDTSESLEGAPSASLFRIVRLVKLVRLVRLLEGDTFKDLYAMVIGMLGGASTLGWAIVLFFLVIYVVSLLFREMLGNQPNDHIYTSFRTVPKSLFTTFRCSFGDCNDQDGYPIFEHVGLAYGGWYCLFYCFFVFTITIGLFNVISAMFVESMMTTATAMERKKTHVKLQDKKLWAKSICAIIRALLTMADEEDRGDYKLSDRIGEIMNLNMDRNLIDAVVKKGTVVSALDELDIERADHKHLSDILDPSNTGQVHVPDLVDGLRRLRGEPRRSDIICVDLMIRSIQEDIVDIHNAFGLAGTAPVSPAARTSKRSSKILKVP